MIQDFIKLISIFSLAIGCFMVVFFVTRSVKKLSFKILLTNILILIYWLIIYLLIRYQYIFVKEFIFIIRLQVVFLLGPISFLFVKKLLYDEEKMNRREWLHLLPFILSIMFYLPNYWTLVSMKLGFIQEQNISEELFYSNAYGLKDRITVLLSQISFLTYLIYSFRLFFVFKKEANPIVLRENASVINFAKYTIIIKAFLVILTFLIRLFLADDIGRDYLTLISSFWILFYIVFIMKNPEMLYGVQYPLSIQKNIDGLFVKLNLEKNRLLAMTQSAHDTNIFLDINFKVLYFNILAEERILKAFNAQLKIGDDFKKYVTPSTSDYFYNSFKKALCGERIEFETNVSINGKNELQWQYISFIPIYSKKKELLGVSMTTTNIDERKKAEIKNLEYIKQLESIIWQESHILRAPVANIMGLCQLLKEEDAQVNLEEKTIIINQLYNEAEKLDKIIQEIVTNSHNILH